VKRVLMVEDQPDIRKLIRMALEFESWQVHEAVDAPSGVEVARQVLPDVILMDVMMPGEFDGLEACRRIKADPLLKNTKLVVVSAKGLASDVDAGKAAGADEYLFKPFSPLELIDTIERLTGGA
jgi:two-component system, OmpR family, phosphate regulon response regulator PhoB